VRECRPQAPGIQQSHGQSRKVNLACVHRSRNAPPVARLWLVLPLLLVTGCGASANFSRDTSANCVRLHGGRVSIGTDDLDAIARQADAGAFRARLGVDTATVAFERTSDDAKRMEAAYSRVLGTAGEPTKYLLFRNRNAVVTWAHVPGDDNRATVVDCLVSR
jgi:hypothetical protein